MLTRAQIVNLLQTVEEADAFADDGDLVEGCAVLVAALCLANEEAERGEPWGEEWVGVWQEALQSYLTRHNLILE